MLKHEVGFASFVQYQLQGQPRALSFVDEYNPSMLAIALRSFSHLLFDSAEPTATHNARISISNSHKSSK